MRSIKSGLLAIVTALVMILSPWISTYASISPATRWGQIIGTLSNQTDLQNALNAKLATASLCTQMQAEAGSNNTCWNSALRTAQAIAALAGGGSYLVKYVTLSQSDIEALATTPVELIAAPGAGKYIQLLNPIGLTINFNTTQYTVYTEIPSLIQYSSGPFAASVSILSIAGSAISKQYIDNTSAESPVNGNVVNASVSITTLGASGRVTTSELVDGGDNWEVGDTFASGFGSVTGTVNTVSSGAIVTYTIDDPGTGVAVGDVLDLHPPGGLDHGLRTVTIDDGGLGYAVNDEVTVDDDEGVNGTLTITSIGALGVVTGLSISNPGFGYAVENSKTTTTTIGAGAGLIVNVTAILGSNASIQADVVQSFAGGDSTIRLAIMYLILDSQ